MSHIKNLLNLCPHDVVIRGVDCVSYEKSDGGKRTVKYLALGQITLDPRDPGNGARCSTKAEVKNEDHTKYLGFRVIEAPEYDNVTGLPTDDDDGNTGIVVSMVVGQQIAKHPELWKGPVYGPDDGPSAIRDEKNQIKCVTGLILYKK